MTKYSDIEKRRRWLIADYEDENKNPASGWKHPREKHSNRTDIVKNVSGYLYCTAKTPKTWLDYNEALDIIASNDKNGVWYPAYVHSKTTTTAQHSNRGLIFIDFDYHPEYDEWGDGIIWMTECIEKFTEFFGDIPMYKTVSENGYHILFECFSQDSKLWDKHGHGSIECPYDPDIGKIEWWSPFSAGGRYRIYTGAWDIDNNDTIPNLSYSDWIEYTESLEQEQKESEYPLDIKYELSEAGDAYRIASYFDKLGYPIISNNKMVLFVTDPNTGISYSFKDPDSHAYPIIKSLYRQISESYAIELDEIGESFAKEFRQKTKSIDSSRYLNGVIEHLEYNSFSNDRKGMYKIIHRGNYINDMDMNKEYFTINDRDSLLITSDRRVFSLAKKEVLEPEKVYDRLITGDLTHSSSYYRDDVVNFNTVESTYAKKLVESWGDSFDLIIWLLGGDRKKIGVTYGGGDLGKTALFSGLEHLGLTRLFGEPMNHMLVGPGRKPDFDLVDNALTQFPIVCFDECANDDKTGKETIDRPFATAKMKSWAGKSTAVYNDKFVRASIRRKKGNIFLLGNYVPLINAYDDMLKQRLLYIAPPKFDPWLRQYPRETIYNSDAQLMLLYLVAERFDKVCNFSDPPMTAEQEHELPYHIENMANRWKEHYGIDQDEE